MRRSRFITFGAIVVVGVGSGLFAWRWAQRGPEVASVGGAVDRFRTSSTADLPAGRRQPAAGVYVYDGSGTEKLSFLGTRQTQGPTIPATVVPGRDGCWQFRIDYNSFHQQTWNRCSTGTTITESGNTIDQHFDFMAFGKSEHSVTTCDPPIVVADLAAEPNAETPIHCTGRSETTKSTFTQTGTATFVGRETIAVGTARVPAIHTRETTRLGGAQTGEARVDIWFAVANGLPVAETHSLRVDSPAPSPLNRVTYTENGRWQLTSLTPRT